jgi:hypothetical protein
MQKVHFENFFRENSQKIDKNFDVSFSSTFFVFLRFQVLLSDGSPKTQQKIQTPFFSIFLIAFLGVSL